MTYETLQATFNLSAEQIEKFKTYLDFLLQYNQMVNLTSITDEQEAIEKHFYDSLLVSKHVDLANKNIIDVGSGAGFPGLPLAIYYPSSTFTLLEPRHKRADFLIECVNILKLTNVTVIAERSENIKEKFDSYDVVLSRAVAPLNILVELLFHLSKINGQIIALKSSSSIEEIKQSKNALKVLNLKICDIYKDELPTNKDIRSIIVLTRIKETLNKYPRPYGQIKNKPL